MKYNIIKTDSYLIVVDDSKKEGDWVFNNISKEIYKFYEVPVSYEKKIIAHLPLNNSPVLEGVDLLPELEDELIGKPFDNYIKERHSQDESIGFIDGYSKAKEKYKYTEEDLRKAIEMARYGYVDYDDNDRDIPLIGFYKTEDEVVQSLSQPKYPVAINVEMEVIGVTDDGVNKIEDIKNTTNSQGQKVWKGDYVYE